MTGKTERVVLVKGGADKWYEQAIFIVNTNAPAEDMPIDFVAEAEKIINDYNLTRDTKKTAQGPESMAIVPIQPIVRPYENHQKPSIVLGVLMIFACLIIVGVLLFGLLS